jgi:hypothetical protein
MLNSLFAALFVFALEGGIGCERLSEFFHLLRLQQHIGVSPSALRQLRTRMEEKILEYQLHVQSQVKQDGREVELCAAADEKFFDQVVLVMLDLPSGYILVEELTENRQYPTWQLSTQQALQDFGFKVKYFVSDRAKALVKLALNDLGCPSIADLFHALFELSKSLGWELNCLASRIEKQLQLARSNHQSAISTSNVVMARQQPSVYLEKHFPIYSNGLSPKWESCQHLESQEKLLWKQQLVYLLSHLNFTFVSQKNPFNV